MSEESEKKDENINKSDDDLAIRLLERRATIFAEEAITNMLDFMGPLATVDFLMFWIREINGEMVLIDT